MNLIQFKRIATRRALKAAQVLSELNDFNNISIDNDNQMLFVSKRRQLTRSYWRLAQDFVFFVILYYKFEWIENRADGALVSNVYSTRWEYCDVHSTYTGATYKTMLKMINQIHPELAKYIHLYYFPVYSQYTSQPQQIRDKLRVSIETKIYTNKDHFHTITSKFKDLLHVYLKGKLLKNVASSSLVYSKSELESKYNNALCKFLPLSLVGIIVDLLLFV